MPSTKDDDVDAVFSADSAILSSVDGESRTVSNPVIDVAKYANAFLSIFLLKKYLLVSINSLSCNPVFVEPSDR